MAVSSQKIERIWFLFRQKKRKAKMERKWQKSGMTDERIMARRKSGTSGNESNKRDVISPLAKQQQQPEGTAGNGNEAFLCRHLTRFRHWFQHGSLFTRIITWLCREHVDNLKKNIVEYKVTAEGWIVHPLLVTLFSVPAVSLHRSDWIAHDSQHVPHSEQTQTDRDPSR